MLCSVQLEHLVGYLISALIARYSYTKVIEVKVTTLELQFCNMRISLGENGNLILEWDQNGNENES